MSAGRLAQKIAIVTGATEGIGLSVARLFVAEEARVVAVARRRELGEQLVFELGADHVIFVGGDVVTQHTADAAIEAAVEDFGGLDILVNNAGLDLSGIALLDTTGEQARTTFDVNFFGALQFLQAAARVMAEDAGGAIVNVVSRTALVGVPGMAVYGASKGALLSLTRTAAVEFAGLGIRVNAVAPGLTETPLVREWIDAQEEPEVFRANTAATIPLGRFAEPEEVAAAILYLSSDEASYVTGATLSIDGGYTAG